MQARYHLRFQIHPTADAAADAAELARFCADAGVQEAVLLLNAEELYTGHSDKRELDRWFDATAVATEVLRGAGIEVSLNPWVTSGHADRGRSNPLGFTPMVGSTGRTAASQASFACPRWREWIVGYYGRFAELEPRVLWLEDDFRYHNHAPLAWGGFEQPMLDRLAALVARTDSGARAPEAPAADARAKDAFTREAVLAAVTAPGPPHPWRALLQQVWRTAQLEVAELVAAEVAVRSEGRSRLGLMSSQLGVASVEGRDWSALFEALAVNGRTVHRPHFARYTDAPGRDLSFSVWMLEQQRALRPSWVTSEPEIENWPHTAWSKSDTQTWSELVSAQLAGSDALLLNLHPMQAGRAGRFPAVRDLLVRSRPALDWIAERLPSDAARDAPAEGVGLPFATDTAAQVRTGGDGDLDALAVDPGPAADFLLRYGVPVTATGARSAPVRAVFGQAAWSFGLDELRTMLADGLLLDGAAAAVLGERGLGELIGVRVSGIVRRDEQVDPGPYAVEQVLADGPAKGAVLSVNNQSAFARLEPAAGAVVWTQILTAGLEYWGAGRCGFTNALGGRVVVLAATAPDALPYDDDGQHLLHAAIRFLEGSRPRLPLVSGGPHLIPQLTRTQHGIRLAIANGSADPSSVRVDLPGPVTFPRATVLSPLVPPRPVTALTSAGCVEVPHELPHRGWLVLEYPDEYADTTLLKE
ncbi:hypothetical protein ACEZDB_24275 [Streptacidiphilus sp. N1-3]|uniref:Uncharacterized protein n=1 Tax=Streptacidiphilus alkalitolerans TaxID=3342712 RepID=A0ABV6X6I7_9ACTN